MSWRDELKIFVDEQIPEGTAIVFTEADLQRAAEQLGFAEPEFEKKKSVQHWESGSER